MKWFYVLKNLSPEERSDTERFWPEEDLDEHARKITNTRSRLKYRNKVNPSKEEIYDEMKHPTSTLRKPRKPKPVTVPGKRGRVHWLIRSGIGFGDDEAASKRKANVVYQRLRQRLGKPPTIRQLVREWRNPKPAPKYAVSEYKRKRRKETAGWWGKVRPQIRMDTPEKRARAGRVYARIANRIKIAEGRSPTPEELAEEWHNPSEGRRLTLEQREDRQVRRATAPISQLVITYGTWALQNNIPIEHLENFIHNEEGRELTEIELNDIERWKELQGL